MNNDIPANADDQMCYGSLISTGAGPVQRLRCQACDYEIVTVATHIRQPVQREPPIALTPAQLEYLEGEIAATLSLLGNLGDAVALRNRACIQERRERLNTTLDLLLEVQQRYQASQRKSEGGEQP